MRQQSLGAEGEKLSYAIFLKIRIFLEEPAESLDGFRRRKANLMVEVLAVAETAKINYGYAI